MFYNTGIATYVWVLTNRKPEHRKGYVQLIDATQWYTPLRQNMGQKNCQLSSEDVEKICDAFIDFKETEQSKIFPNEAFGYWKVTVERPLRIEGIDPEKVHSAKEIRELRTTGIRSESAPRGHKEDTRAKRCGHPAERAVRSHYQGQARSGRVRARPGTPRYRAGTPTP